MFKITPPNVANRNLGNSQQSCNVSDGTHFCACRLFLYLILLLFAGAIVWTGYRSVVKNTEPQPLEFSRALYFNRDSLMYYTELAYLHDDPKGLFVAGAAAYMKKYAELPDTLPTIPFDDAFILLLRSAELGNEDAVSLIRCLDYHNCWGHSLPKQLEK